MPPSRASGHPTTVSVAWTPGITCTAPDGRTLLERLRFARSLASRTRGLLGRRSLADGEGLAFREKSIHMFFMRMSLDIVFCDADLQVAARRPRPFAMAHGRHAGERATCSRSVPGEAARLGLREGMVLRVDPAF